MYRTFVATGLALFCLAVAASAVGGKVGVVSRVGDTEMQLTLRDKKSEVITIDDQTAYMTWVTHKPWQGGEAGRRALTVGRCVNVDLRSGDAAHIAKAVWINTDTEGSVFDPCKGLR
jgi:hypothetical protein